MARYEHLPIYRAAFDLAVHVEKLVRGFTRARAYLYVAEQVVEISRQNEGWLRQTIKARGGGAEEDRCALQRSTAR